MSENMTAEMALLGAVLTDPSILEQVPWFRSSYFALAVHTTIFDAIDRTLKERDGHMDLVLLTEELKDTGRELEAVGGSGYLVHLIDATPSVQAAPHYARIVFEHATRRHLSLLGHQMVFEAKSDIGAAVANMVNGLREVQGRLAAYRKAVE